ncbi:MAG: hypothetical protein LBO66_05105 [Deltaproteobacteria bacterium]|nr:hypothetical protein [Deltaproteobacteria bacterium]
MSTNYCDPKNPRAVIGATADLRGAGRARARPFDLGPLLAACREMGKLLARFRPLEGYAPEPALPEPALSESLTKALGAPTLSDYFILSLKSVEAPAERQREREALPRGPENIPSALAALAEAIEAYAQAAERDPAAYGRTKVELLKTRNALLKAQKLRPDLERLAGDLSREAADKYREAKEFQGKVEEILAVIPAPPQEEEAPEELALTAYTATLSERLREREGVALSRERWGEDLKGFTVELERSLSSVGAERQGRDWAGALQEGRERLAELEKRHVDLVSGRLDADRRLKTAYGSLIAAEKRYAGEKLLDYREKAEETVEYALSLWNAVLDRRVELALFWRQSPALVGRPVFLDKIFLLSAMNLGLSQGIVEDARARLSALTKKLSNTQKIRFEAEKILKAKESDRAEASLLEKAERLLTALASAVRALSETQEAKAELQKVLSETSRATSESEREKRAMKETFAAEILRIQEGNNREIAAGAKRLTAVLKEKERLVAGLESARAELRQSAEAKKELLLAVSDAKEKLETLIRERRERAQELSDAQDAQDALKGRHKRLSELHLAARRKLKALEAELAQSQASAELSLEEARASQAEKRGLERKIGELARELDEVVSAREAQSEKIKSLGDLLNDAKAREAALSVRLASKDGELRETNKTRGALAEAVAGYRAHLERVSLAHEALLKSWRKRGALLSQANLERDDLRLKLSRKHEDLIDGATRLQETQDSLKAVTAKLADLESAKTRLLDSIEEEAAAKMGLQDANALLVEEIAALKSQSGEDLAPLTRVLGLALAASQKELADSLENAARDLEERTLAEGAKIAGVRVKSAAREIDYVQLVDRKDREISQANFEIKSLKEETLRLRENPPEPEGAPRVSELSYLARGLAWALVAARGQKTRLRDAFVKRRHESRAKLARAESAERELKELLAEREKALAESQLWLRDLTELTRFFLQSGRSFWGSPAVRDSQEALFFYLTEENQSLVRDLDSLKGERQELLAERRILLSQNEEIAARLYSFRPLLEFLGRAFERNAYAMAAARAEAPEAPEDSGERATESALWRDLERSRAELARLRKENESLAKTAERQASQLASLAGESAARAQSQKELGELIELKDAQIAQISQESLERGAEAAEDGRVETLWAALNYLATRAGGAIGRLESQLQSQAREIENSYGELQKREERVKNLESRQESLSLLFWLIYSWAMGGLTLPALPPGGDGGGEGGGSAAGAGPESPGAEGGKGGSLSRSFLRELKNAARKSLFSLLLAGGLVLALERGAAAESPSKDPAPSAPTGFFTPFHNSAAHSAGPPPAPRAPAREVAFIAARIFSPTLGRSLDLGFLPPAERDLAPARVEERALEILRAQAQNHGLDLASWLTLIRGAYPPDRPLRLPETQSPQAPFTLLSPLLPEIARILGAKGAAPPPPGVIALALRGASTLKPGEGIFWERIRKDFEKILGDPRESALAAVHHLARGRRALPLVEFGGTLAPIAAVEEMPYERATRFLASFMRQNFKKKVRRRAGPRPDFPYLAADLFYASGLFRLPLTFLVTVAHAHFEATGECPGALEVFAGARDLAARARRLGRFWRSDAPLLLDLDELAGDFPLSRRSPQGLYRKKEALSRFYADTFLKTPLFPDEA